MHVNIFIWNIVHASISTYEDHLARKVINCMPQALQAKGEQLDDALRRVLSEGGLAQNRGEQEVVVHFSGKGSHERMRRECVLRQHRDGGQPPRYPAAIARHVFSKV